MNNYEIVLIFDPVLSEDELNDEIRTYKDIITSEGSIVSEERWGLRPLAYAIKRKTTGIYYLCEFKSAGSVIPKLETQFGRDDKVMRHVVTKLDKYGVEYAERRRQRLYAPKEDAKSSSEAVTAFEALETEETPES